MLLFQLLNRQCHIQGDLTTLADPLEVELEVHMGPEEFFGVADLTGRLREFPEGGSIKFEGTLLNGARRMTTPSGTRMPIFKMDGQFGGAHFNIEGNIAKLRCNIPGPNRTEVLGNVIQYLTDFLPASFSPITTAAISVDRIVGTVNRMPLEVSFLFDTTAPGGEAFRVGHNIASDYSEYLKLISPFLFQLPPKILSAHRYLAQNFLLECKSEYSYQFAGERILNLCKAVEALLDRGSVASIDKMRKIFHQWNMASSDIEVLVTLRYLRSQLDVAHISRTRLTHDEQNEVANFMNLAEQRVQLVIKTAVKICLADPKYFSEEKSNNNKSSTLFDAIRKHRSLFAQQ